VAGDLVGEGALSLRVAEARPPAGRGEVHRSRLTKLSPDGVVALQEPGHGVGGRVPPATFEANTQSCLDGRTSGIER
jgi:hypothetical protein